MEFFKLENKRNEIRLFAENGLKDVVSTGLSCLDPMFMLKKGYPLFIAGAEGEGKTEFLFEILINTSITQKWKHFIYCGEGGNVEHIYNELLQKYLQKPYKWATEREKLDAEMHINEHFIIANHDHDFTFDMFYELVEKTEKELNIKFDTTSFDPFNDFDDEDADQKYLSRVLKKIRVSSKKNNRIDILVNHVADIKPVWDKDEKKQYIPPAMTSQWAGGKMWARRGFTMILVYRPPTFLKDRNGMPFAENEAHIYCQKAKPKGIGKASKTEYKSIFWDWKRNRYYSFYGSQILYSLETISEFQPKLEPNKDFTETINEHNEQVF